jgi:hypothetical protein
MGIEGDYMGEKPDYIGQQVKKEVDAIAQGLRDALPKPKSAQEVYTDAILPDAVDGPPKESNAARRLPPSGPTRTPPADPKKKNGRDFSAGF